MEEELLEPVEAPKKKQVKRSMVGRPMVVVPGKFTKTGMPVKRPAPLPKHLKRKPGPKKKTRQIFPRAIIELEDGTKTTARGKAVKERRERIIKEYFENRQYELVREIKLGPGQHMHTLLRAKARHVFILREINNPHNVVVLGSVVYRKAAAVYGSYEIKRAKKRETDENV